MSYRNPFITSVLSDPNMKDLLIILDKQFTVLNNKDDGNRFVYGFHSRGYPGALIAEEIEELFENVKRSGIAFPFTLAFSGEDAADRLVIVFDGKKYSILNRKESQ
jgi:hypothetical protein